MVPADFSAAKPPAVKLGLQWKRENQRFFCGKTIFVNNGPTQTEPSHDLSHLFVAANGGLLWYPGGTDSDMRIAEYNATFIEYLLHVIYKAIVFAYRDENEILAEIIQHANWFVNEHYAPFPLSSNEAYSSLRSRIDARTITRLSPMFYDLHEREYKDASCKANGVDLEFSASETPKTNDQSSKFKQAVERLIYKISGTQRQPSEDN